MGSSSAFTYGGEVGRDRNLQQGGVTGKICRMFVCAVFDIKPTQSLSFIPDVQLHLSKFSVGAVKARPLFQWKRGSSISLPLEPPLQPPVM